MLHLDSLAAVGVVLVTTTRRFSASQVCVQVTPFSTWLPLAVGANVFNPAFINPTVGIVLTAVLVGGGSNLLHQITQPAPKISGEQPDTIKLGEGAS